MKRAKKITFYLGIIIVCTCIVLLLLGGTMTQTTTNQYVESNWQPEPTHTPEPPSISITYTPMGVPNINSSFKSWMPSSAMYKKAPQYKFLSKWGYVDANGLYRCKAETDLGVTDDYYLVAMGSYYSRTIGDKFRITTNTGNVFYVALTEYKADIHTNNTNQYTLSNNCIVEFVVDRHSLNRNIKQMGSANVYMPLNGCITKIEKMDFVKR